MNIDSRFENEINPFELIRILYQQKAIIFFITLCFSIISIFYSLNVSEKWTSSSILEISSKPSSGGGSSGLSSSGAISSLVGFSSPNKSDSPRAAILLRSKDLVKRLVTKEGVLENMFAFKSFDSINRTSNFKEEIYDSKTKNWLVSAPTYIEAARAYNNIVSVEVDKFNGFITISVTHGSPVFAYEFLELIIQELNSYAKERELSETAKSLDYLYIKLGETFQENVKLSISSLIETQLKKQMFANVSDNFLLNPLDGAFEPDLRSSPQRTRMVILATIAGFLFGTIFVLLRLFLKPNKEK